jgi:polyisoprenoid-binding protein YceI
MSAAYKIPTLAVVLLASLLASCASRPARQTRPASVPQQPAPEAAPQAQEGREFKVDSAASLLTIRVYRGGALGRAGHNHVIASHSLQGVVRVPEDPTHASFEVHMPVNELVVDEEALRAKEGPDFPPGVPDDAKEGTRRNMLGPSLLEAERYPEIVLQSEAIQRSGDGGLEAQVRVIVRDRASSVVVPIKYELTGNELQVQGELPLKQTDLGLTPFSLFGGALKVLDEMKIRFTLVAKAE